jgi:hypothetical protein
MHTQVLVFIDTLPRGPANKTSRIQLAKRCSISAVKETDAQTQRMFEATAPPVGSGIDVPIRTRVVGIDLQEVMRVMRFVQVLYIHIYISVATFTLYMYTRLYIYIYIHIHTYIHIICMQVQCVTCLL